MSADKLSSSSPHVSTGKTTWLRRPFYLGMLLLLALSIGSRLGWLHWSADWLALFIDTYFWLSLAAGGILLLRRKWSWALLAAGLVLLNGSLLWGYTPLIATSRAAESRDLRLFVFNMYYLNADLDHMLDTIEAEEPDIVFLQEYSFDIQSKIEAQFEAYPYRLIEPSRFTMGVALFSKFPLEEATIHRFERTRIPIVEAVFRVNGRSVRFVGGHPWPPLPQWGTLHRNQMLDIQRIAVPPVSEQALIIAGDFNASPWSYAMRQLAATTQTQDVARGHGWQKSFELNSWFKLPLDHVLVSRSWEVVGVTYGEKGGSDHRPLIVDLRLP